MAAIARLAAISVDGPDPVSLSRFYCELLDLEVMFESADFVALKGAGVLLTMQRVDSHRAPDWPDGDVSKQMHLELAVSNLDEAESKAVAAGAVKADIQPAPDRWRVLLDPAGHPFCVTTLIPEV